MSVDSETPRPIVLLEDGGVNVEIESKVILDEILARCSDIQRVPVVELASHDLKSFLVDSGVKVKVISTREHVIPDIIGNLFWLDTKGSNFLSVQILVEEMSE
jgi:hypothetical protein